ncbi:MAG: hypothetical protein IIT83_08095, partial [Bacteroidales bacterium]|nr:hypothetical protein [Bacteroidales bacterium]
MGLYWTAGINANYSGIAQSIFLGAKEARTDAQMGNVRPDNTSALMVLQNASEVPLENTRAGLHEWVE